MINLSELIKGLEQCGIKDNDLVMVHSSYKSLGGVDGGAETVVNAFTELVNPKGAVFFPTYTIDAWCGGRYFDIAETPSEMGAITETARNKPGAFRTKHPIHSFSILGAYRYAFQFDNRESFAPDSPYGYFHRENGLVISIGVPWNDTFSFVHYCEQAGRAEFRRKKNFAGIYMSGWGIPTLESYQMSVRKTQRHITNVAPLYDEVLVPEGVVKQCQVGAATVSYFRCQEYFEAVTPLVKSRPELFHYVKGWQA